MPVTLYLRILTAARAEWERRGWRYVRELDRCQVLMRKEVGQ